MRPRDTLASGLQSREGTSPWVRPQSAGPRHESPRTRTHQYGLKHAHAILSPIKRANRDTPLNSAACEQRCPEEKTLYLPGVADVGSNRRRGGDNSHPVPAPRGGAMGFRRALFSQGMHTPIKALKITSGPCS